MAFLVSLFWNICLTRKGPEDVPAQYTLIALLIIGKIVLVLGVSAVVNEETNALSLITQVVTWSALVGLLTALALQIAGHFERFAPTFGAILGSELVMVALYVAIFLAARFSGYQYEPNADTLFNTITNLFNILVQLWKIFVVGFIMHRALNLNIMLGITIGLFIMIVSLSISSEVARLA